MCQESDLNMPGALNGIDPVSQTPGKYYIVFWGEDSKSDFYKHYSDDEDFTQYGRQRHEHHDEDQDEFHTRPRATTPPRGSRWDQKTPALPKEDLSDPRIRRLMQAKMT